MCLAAISRFRNSAGWCQWVILKGEPGEDAHCSSAVWAKSLPLPPHAAKAPVVLFQLLQNHTYTEEFSCEDIQVSTKSAICFCFNSGHWALKEEWRKVREKVMWRASSYWMQSFSNDAATIQKRIAAILYRATTLLFGVGDFYWPLKKILMKKCCFSPPHYTMNNDCSVLFWWGGGGCWQGTNEVCTLGNEIYVVCCYPAFFSSYSQKHILKRLKILTNWATL